MCWTIEACQLRIVHVGLNVAAGGHKTVVFDPMRRRSEMYPLRVNRLGQFSSQVPVGTHLGGSPVGKIAVIHRKAIMMLKDRNYILRSRQFEKTRPRCRIVVLGLE